MKDTNQVVIVGRLTRDGELKYSQSGFAVLNFGIAVNRSVKDQMSGEYKDEASFFDVTAFGKSAEAVAKFLTKGKQVAVVGELVQDRWEKDGQKQSRVKINADMVQLLASPASGGQDHEFHADRNAALKAVAPEVRRVAEVMGSGRGDGFQDDIPF